MSPGPAPPSRPGPARPRHPGPNPPLSPLRSCPFLARHLTPAIPAIAALLLLFVLSCLLQTSFRDPGILPRATAAEAADLEKRIGEAARGALCGQGRGPEPFGGFGTPGRCRLGFPVCKTGAMPASSRAGCVCKALAARGACAVARVASAPLGFRRARGEEEAGTEAGRAAGVMERLVQERRWRRPRAGADVHSARLPGDAAAGSVVRVRGSLSSPVAAGSPGSQRNQLESR